MTFNKMATQSLLIIAVAGFLAHCSTYERAGEPGGNIQMLDSGVHAQDDYLKVVESFSSGDAEYHGFYNQMTYKATLHNSPVAEAISLRQAEYFKWDPRQLEQEKQRVKSQNLKKTEVFMSFYTPDRRNDNLADNKSIWRVYLDVGSKRFQGQVRKAKKLLPELQALYPYHTRWNTAYIIEFDVPVAHVESEKAEFTLTGPLGAKSVHFPAAAVQ